jgi:adenylate kinase family enzyme
MEEIELGKRVMIIGSCGAGKSTLSIQLNEIIDIPIIHLDKEYWKPGWVESGKEEWYEKQNKLVEKENWIIDGNYGGSLDIRFSKADTVIFLDYGKYICLYRIIKRSLQNIGKNRIDMAEGCNEKIVELSFIKFVWDFPKKSRPKIIDKIEEYNKINKIILKNPKETKLFLEKVKELAEKSKNCV